MDYRKTYKTSSKVAIDKIKELEKECARLAKEIGVVREEKQIQIDNRLHENRQLNFHISELKKDNKNEDNCLQELRLKNNRLKKQVADSKTVNYSENALELANEKIKGLDATIEHRNISLNDMRDRMFTERNKKEKLQDQLKQKNETIIHLAQVQMEMEREK